MAGISIADMLRHFGTNLEKKWEHDRLNTVGASEVGQCLRKTWFAKHEEPRDPDYVDRYGARMRGDIIETHYWVPGLRATLPPGVKLLYAGEEQRTLADGYLSATTDGLLIGVDRDALAWAGIPDIEADCINLDCKSIDPRAGLPREKPEHSFQVQAQVGLLRHATPYQPTYSILSYVDASFLDNIEEFAVRFDPEIYQVAQSRARLAMTADNAIDLRPEGKMAGGQECKYCPWASHCADVQVAGVPRFEEAKPLDPVAISDLKNMRDYERDLADELNMITNAHSDICERIREFLRVHEARGHRGDGWSVSWSAVKGRTSIDTAALEQAGVDLSLYQKPGKPGDRLTIK